MNDAIRDEIMRLMREDFDPTPPNWGGRDWCDNAEDVTEKIVALFADPHRQSLDPDRLRAALAEAERERDEAISALANQSRLLGKAEIARDAARATAKSIYHALEAAQKPLDAEFMAAIFSDVEALYEP